MTTKKNYRRSLDGINTSTKRVVKLTGFQNCCNDLKEKRFVRIRHYGILSASWKRGKLQQLQTKLKVDKPEVKPKTMLRKCPCCKTGTLITIEVFGKRGPPSIYIVEKQSAAQA